MTSHTHPSNRTHRFLWFVWAVAVLGFPLLSLSSGALSNANLGYEGLNVVFIALGVVVHLLTSVLLAIQFGKSQSGTSARINPARMVSALFFAGWMVMTAVLTTGCKPRFP